MSNSTPPPLDHEHISHAQPTESEQANPYSPPSAASLQFDEEIVSESDETLKVFVGEKYLEYYQNKWFKDRASSLENDSGQVTTNSFNLAGFFLGLFWMCYRKMYLWAFALTMVITTIDIIFIHIFASPEGRFEGLPTNLVWIVLTGFFGNYLYFLHSTRQIKKTLAEHNNPAVIQHELKTLGGTSWLGAIGVGVGIVIIMILMYGFLTPDWFMAE